MRVSLILVAMAAVLMTGGCSTSRVGVDYRSTAAQPSQQATPLVQVGTFADERGVDPNFLGAIRGGFGNPLKTLETEQPLKEVVRKGFGDGLAARGLLKPGDAPLVLSAGIQKFDCSQYVRREAHARIMLTLKDARSGKVLLNQLFERDIAQDNPNLLDVGILADVKDLQAVAVQLLRDIVDTALDNLAVRDAIAAAAKAG